jgi:PucR family transcriptional regulator, purine catabolism regulatory protein
MTTLRDIMRFTMPSSSRLLTGEDGLYAQIHTVVGLRATLPAFPDLRGGELTLISPAQAMALDESLTLPTIISRLGEVPVAAIAVAGPPDAAAQIRAVAANIPLVELPAAIDLRSLERDIHRLIADPDLQIERWASQLYSELTQRILNGAGINGVLQSLVERTGRSVACYSVSGRLRAQQMHEGARPVFEILRPEASGELHILGQQVYVEQIGDTGWLALAGTELDQGDRLAARQGAAALALELAKEQAVKDAEARVRGDLVRTILSGTPVDAESINNQAAELGYQLDKPHVAVVIAPTNGDSPASLQPLVERILQQRKIIAPVLAREDSMLVFVPLVGSTTAHTILDALQQTQPVTAGLSSVAANATQWSRALDEAEQALALGRQLFGNKSVTAFADLGIYRLLLAQRDSPELGRFYRDTLGPLLDHGSSSADLIDTLEGYFLARGNVSRAATLLHVHRNTLIYRLQRISEIAGIDWERAEDQLALQIALKVHRVLRMSEFANTR